MTVDVSTASCNDMDWSGASNSPVFNASSTANILKIYGSFKLIDAMTWSFSGKVYFEATATGKILTTFNKNFLNDVNFNGAGGEWTLQDAFSCAGYVTYLNYGTLNTNNQTLTLYRFDSYNSNTRALNLGSSLVIIGYSFSNSFYVSFNTSFAFNAGTSTLRFPGNNNATTGIYAYNATVNFSFYNVEFTGPVATGSIMTSNPACRGTFNNVTFSGHGTITGNNTFNNLAFTAGKTYTLPASLTQTITGIFQLQAAAGS